MSFLFKIFYLKDLFCFLTKRSALSVTSILIAKNIYIDALYYREFAQKNIHED